MDSTSTNTMLNPDPAIDATPSNALNDAVMGSEEPDNALPANDVAMSRAGFEEAEPEALDDGDLPQWLTSMLDYLRGVALDTAWQDLVKEFLDFEKSCPPNGVSFIFHLSFSLMQFNVLNSTYLRSSDPKRSLIGSRAKRRMSYHCSNPTTAIDSRSGGRQCCHLGGRPTRRPTRRPTCRHLFAFPAMHRLAKGGRY